MVLLPSKKGLTSSSAASIIGNNGNLLVDILYHLPAKSLCVFKTVSKQWLSLISDPFFERNYNLYSRRLFMPALFMKKRLTGSKIESNFETLVMDERNGNYYVPFNTLIIAGTYIWRICFEQSCNGLVLCKLNDAYLYTPHVIYNPSMKHFKKLPPPPVRETGAPRVMSVSIAFDPEKSSYYEVVVVCETYTRKDLYLIVIYVYSSKTDSWRATGDPFPFSEPVALSQSGLYWNGSVHWINKQSAKLHYFDIHCGLMKTTAMPTRPYSIGVIYSREIVYFDECRGHIHLIEMFKNDMSRLDIWEMRKDYTGWNVKSYDLTPLTTAYPDMVLGRLRSLIFHPFELNVLLVEEGGEEEGSYRLILLIGKGQVISFDLNNKSFKKLYDVSPDVWVTGFRYVETLAHA